MQKFHILQLLFIPFIALATMGLFEHKPIVKEEWVRFHHTDENEDETAHAMAIDEEGNVYVVGTNTEYGYRFDTFVIKYSPSGEILWQDFIQYAHVKNIAIDPEGNIIIAGDRYDDVFLKKYDPQGNRIFEREEDYYPESYEFIEAMILDDEGNIIITGATIIDERHFILTAKFSNEGQKYFMTHEFDYGFVDTTGYALATDEAGSVYVTGAIRFGLEDSAWTTLKYTSFGYLLWGDYYGYGGFEYGRGITVNDNGDVIVLGHFKNITMDMMLILRDGERGGEIKRVVYHGGGIDESAALAKDSQGNIIITGTSDNGSNREDIVVLKYDDQLNPIWGPSRHEGFDEEHANRMVIDQNDDIFITGTKYHWSTHHDLLTLKFNGQTGEEVWSQRHFGTVHDGWDNADNIAVDNDGNVYVAGFEEVGHVDRDAVVIKYAQLAIVEADIEILTPIVAPGDNVRYRATVTNNTFEDQNFFYRVDAKFPDGTWKEVVPLSPAALGSNESRMFVDEKRILSTMPVGDYTFRTFIQDDVGMIWDVEDVEVRVQ